MHEFFHAVHVFFDELAAVGWTMLGIALGLHVGRLVLRAIAWRTIVSTAYPGTRIPFSSAFGAYVAGVGVNSVVPARAGDVLKLFLLKRRVEGSTYPTLGSTLIVETLLDLVVAGSLLLWALTLGVLPGLDVLPNLPSIDWSWPLRHPRQAALIGTVWLVVLVLFVIWAARRVVEFKQRVAQGFAVLRDRRRFLGGVVFPQALSWVLRIASAFFFLRAFHVGATIHNALLVQVVQSLSTLLPFSPGGAGTQQGLIAYVLRGDASTTTLLAFSVGMYIAITVANALLGFAAIGVMLRTLRWRRLLARHGELAAAKGPDVRTP